MEKAKLKKIMIVSAIFLILVLAIITSLSVLNVSRKNYSGSTGGFSGVAVSSLPSEMGRSADSLAPSAMEKNVSQMAETESPASIDKKVIKNGNITAKVANVDNSAKDIESIAKGNGGEVFSINFSQDEDKIKSGTITVKVPVANFEKTFGELKKVASLVLSESASGQDVTEQYTDLQSRLKNKQAEEQAFANILGRAADTDDIIKITRELARVRGEIELLQGQIRYFDSQTDMSQISLYLSEDENITITDTWRPWQIVKDAVNSLITKLQTFVSFLIVLIITVIPILAIYLFLFYVIYRIGKKIYHKMKGKKADGENAEKQNLQS
jgi:hypothetical protein